MSCHSSFLLSLSLSLSPSSPLRPHKRTFRSPPHRSPLGFSSIRFRRPNSSRLTLPPSPPPPAPLLSHILSAPAPPSSSPSPSPSATASCPATISVPRDQLTSSSNGRGVTVELLCGMEAGSHVTVVSRPRAARSERDPRVAERREGEAPVMVSQFMVELLGTKAVQGEEPLLDTALQPKDPRGFQRPPHDRAQHLLPDAVGAATAVRGVAVAAERGDRLLRLGVDYVDLYQIHWPDRYVPMFGETEYDPSRQYTSVPIEEQLEVLGRAIHVGKVHWP